MGKMIQIPEWQFKHIENALRLTHRINKCASKETAFDREVVKAYEFAFRALTESSHESSGLNKPVVSGSLPAEPYTKSKEFNEKLGDFLSGNER